MTVRFGGLVAVDEVSISLARGEILGLIGPNGAGKTTLVNVLSGFQRPLAGAIAIGERDCTRLPRHGFPRAGVVRTFQAVRLFRGLTVSENVEIGYVAQGLCRTRGRAARARHSRRTATRPRRRIVPAAGLSYGEERRVGLARALAVNPRFLLLDEPAAGLAAAEAEELRQLILRHPVDVRLRRAGDRAQHGAGDEPVRAHPRARRRQDDRNRARRRRSAPMPACAAPISAPNALQ